MKIKMTKKTQKKLLIIGLILGGILIGLILGQLFLNDDKKINNGCMIDLAKEMCHNALGSSSVLEDYKSDFNSISFNCITVPFDGRITERRELNINDYPQCLE